VTAVSLPVIAAVARREFTVRARSRAYRLGTLVLLVVTCGFALSPVLLRLADALQGPQTVGVALAEGGDPGPAAVILGRLLAVAGGSLDPSRPAYRVTPVPDVDAGEASVRAGDLAALLVVSRRDGGLAFILYTRAQPWERTPQLVQQAAAAVAIQDRLQQLRIPASDQAALLAPPPFQIQRVGGPGTASAGGPAGTAEGLLLGQGLTVLIFIAVILYGQWVALSVAEEKSTRVIELVLGAARPFDILAGKVLGVGALGLVQYVIVFAPAILLVFFQDRIAAALLGTPAAGSDLAPLLTPVVVLAFGVYFVLGFALYAVLYAGTAALVSRVEDVNYAVMPLTLLAGGGYGIALYAALGQVSLPGPVLSILTVIPFFSPFVVLPRLALGSIEPPEVATSLVLLVATIPLALAVAARLYRAGLLLYGQRPGLATLLRALRP
jgi:ABC-2 type transport system permease protein